MNGDSALSQANKRKVYDMRVFIAWSGEESLQMARATLWCLPKVIQSVKAFMSEEIPKGAPWLNTLNSELGAAKFGIVCVTAENLGSPWLNYETGAIAKALNTAVSPLITRVNRADLKDPIAIFQTTSALDHTDMLRMFTTMNSICEAPLPEVELRETFDKWWPDIMQRYGEIDIGKQPAERQRSPDEVLEETLSLVREQGRQLADQGALIRELIDRSPRVSTGYGTRLFPNATLSGALLQVNPYESRILYDNPSMQKYADQIARFPRGQRVKHATRGEGEVVISFPQLILVKFLDGSTYELDDCQPIEVLNDPEST